jgi:hypothetical protein
MAKRARNNWDVFDTPYETQPPEGSAEPDINYGGIAEAADREPNDPSGVLPEETKPHNIGPGGGTGHRG